MKLSIASIVLLAKTVTSTEIDDIEASKAKGGKARKAEVCYGHCQAVPLDAETLIAKVICV